MLGLIRKFERVIIIILTILMAAVLLLAAIELGYVLVKEIITPPVILLGITQMLEIFGFFLLVLIGIELLDTMKTFMAAQEARVQVVFMVALIAIARKVIVLDLQKISSFTLLGIAAIIISLSVGFFLIRQITRRPKKDEEVSK